MAKFKLIKRIDIPDTINILDKNIKCSDADEDGDVWYYVDYGYRDDEGDMIYDLRYAIQVLPEGYVRLSDEMGAIISESIYCDNEEEMCDAIEWCVIHINELLSELKDVEVGV